MPQLLRISLALLFGFTIPHAVISGPQDAGLESHKPPNSKHGGPVTSVLNLGARIASCSQAGILHTEIDGGDPLWLRDLAFRPYALASVSSDATIIAVGGGTPGESGVVALLDINDFTIIAQRSISKDLVYAISVDSPSNTIAAACNDGTIVTLALDDLKHAPITTQHRHTATARDVAFSPDGRWLASAGHDGVVLISEWPPASGDEIAGVRSLAGHTDQVHCLAFSPASDAVASGSRDGKVRLHNIGGSLLRTYAELDGEPVSDLVWQSGVFASSLGGAFHGLAENDDSALLLAQLRDPIFAIAKFPKAVWAVGTHQIEILTPPSNRHPPAGSAR